MKKFYLVLALLLLVGLNGSVQARCHAHYHSTPVYVVRSDYFETEGNFPDCKDHFYVAKTTINHYSNGTRRTFNNYTVFDKNETIILADCNDIKHVVHNNKHYFLARKGSTYQIYDEKGSLKTVRNYTKMAEISKNRVLVRVNKKYGVIDLNEKIVIPMKYKSMKKFNKNLLLTKLNGYWGILDLSNKQILPNEYDSVKQIYDTYRFKKQGKFLLVDLNGNLVSDIDCDSIKKLGEYILAKKDGLCKVYDSEGRLLTAQEFKKVKLERNSLQGKLPDNTWVKINIENF